MSDDHFKGLTWCWRNSQYIWMLWHCTVLSTLWYYSNPWFWNGLVDDTFHHHPRMFDFWRFAKTWFDRQFHQYTRDYRDHCSECKCDKCMCWYIKRLIILYLSDVLIFERCRFMQTCWDLKTCFGVWGSEKHVCWSSSKITFNAWCVVSVMETASNEFWITSVLDSYVSCTTEI